MKLMFASDLHGDAVCTEKLLSACSAEQPDQLILLGDLLYHGPRNDMPAGYAPKQVISLLNPIARSLLCVRGNCDTEVDQMVLDFPILADYAVVYADGLRMYLTHGHHPVQGVRSGDIMISGHTHIPRCETENGVLYLNPGSVSIPKEGSEKQYMIYENRCFSWKTLSGTVLRTFGCGGTDEAKES